VPSPSAGPTPVASDAPVPVSLRAAIEPARRALHAAWAGPPGVDFRFARAHCAIGAEVGLVFRQRTPGRPDSWAMALSHDVAKGIVLGAWGVRFDVAEPATEPTLVALLGDREIACP
jgi:hypothetical protein